MHPFVQPGCTKEENSRVQGKLQGGSGGDRAFSEAPESFVPEGLYLEASKNTADVEANENVRLRALNSFS